MCKFQDFSATQILREINFEGPRSPKTASQSVTMADFETLDSPKLISRKI